MPSNAAVLLQYFMTQGVPWKVKPENTEQEIPDYTPPPPPPPPLLLLLILLFLTLQSYVGFGLLLRIFPGPSVFDKLTQAGIELLI